MQLLDRRFSVGASQDSAKRSLRRASVCALLALLLGACASTLAPPTPSAGETPSAAQTRQSIERVLDDFHRAAAQADEARYFDHFAPDAVFLGTDPKERWTVDEFRAYAHPWFAQGKGWSYTVLERHVHAPAHDSDTSAWFDEALYNEKYGPCRGSGVLVRTGGGWKIAQYNLSIPIANELALSFVEAMRAAARAAPKAE